MRLALGFSLAALCALGSSLGFGAPLGVQTLETTTTQAEAKAVDCVESRAEARYGAAGYDHYVHLKSQCERRVACQVTTNVNPDPTKVTLDPGKEASVLTFRGSPAREFEARVTCAYGSD